MIIAKSLPLTGATTKQPMTGLDNVPGARKFPNDDEGATQQQIVTSPPPLPPALSPPLPFRPPTSW
ncbi:hypothetical protein L249_1333 [Ophiocordyceps polyrhachis-furcata BCC 54312]|uniref:Uncharacterized protein n=1 Tax=Ophiocordyceps polyrhachis-furcata BCC 54312 TaxID=1330021 RepID=A0A367LCV1_9HYPO|nr:hypothetical protein L249_1333 [Ophiocordyceps polyrhachis-furcata BCC 54312]